MRTGIIGFLHNTYTNFVLKFKFVIIVMMLIPQGFFIYKAMQLTPDPEAPAFLPDKNNFAAFKPAVANHFSGWGGGPRNLRLSIAFGFADPPIDRKGTSSANSTDIGNQCGMNPSIFGAACKRTAK